MYGAVEKNYKAFTSSIQYPMGFWIKKAEISANKLTLEWTASYDLQGDDISYDVQISTDPNFTPSSIIAEITGIETTQHVFDWNHPENYYFLRVLARDSANPVDHWQLAFNEYIYNDREYHGVVALQDTAPPLPSPSIPSILPFCEAGADPQTIKLGEGTALWWWTQDTLNATINNGIGNVDLPSNYNWIYPTQTTTYTMTAKGANDTTATCQTTVVVESNDTISAPICALGVDPQIIDASEGTTLWWWTQHAVSANIDNNIGNVTLPSNYNWIHPARTTTYKIKTVGADGTTSTCNTTITVR